MTEVSTGLFERNTRVQLTRLVLVRVNGSSRVCRDVTLANDLSGLVSTETEQRKLVESVLGRAWVLEAAHETTRGLDGRSSGDASDKERRQEGELLSDEDHYESRDEGRKGWSGEGGSGLWGKPAS